MTDITAEDIETAREFIAHVRKYRAVTGPNAVTAVRVLEALMPAPNPTLAEELRELAKWVNNPIWCETKAKVESMADRAEQIEQERDEARADLADVTEVNQEIRRERDEARAEIVRCRETIRKHKEQTDRAVDERDEALAEVERLKAINHTPQPPHRRGLHS